MGGDDYLLRLSRYIHLNPVKTSQWQAYPVEEKVRHLRRCRWSSYPAYIGEGPAEKDVAYAPLQALVPGRGGATDRYRKFVEAGLAQTDEEFVSLMRQPPLLLGPDEFVASVPGRCGDAAEALLRAAALRQAPAAAPVAAVLAAVCQTLGIQPADVQRKRRDGLWRGLAAYALVRKAGLTQQEAAVQLALKTGAAVSYLIRRLKTRMQEDEALARRVDRLMRED